MKYRRTRDCRSAPANLRLCAGHLCRSLALWQMFCSAPRAQGIYAKFAEYCEDASAERAPVLHLAQMRWACACASPCQMCGCTTGQGSRDDVIHTLQACQLPQPVSKVPAHHVSVHVMRNRLVKVRRFLAKTVAHCSEE